MDNGDVLFYISVKNSLKGRKINPSMGTVPLKGKHNTLQSRNYISTSMSSAIDL
jgi:hypothetical protein